MFFCTILVCERVSRRPRCGNVKGKKLFQGGPMAAVFSLQETMVSSDGVIFAHYKRAGEVKTDSVGE